jgi:hypothetical protein
MLRARMLRRARKARGGVREGAVSAHWLLSCSCD